MYLYNALKTLELFKYLPMLYKISINAISYLKRSAERKPGDTSNLARLQAGIDAVNVQEQWQQPQPQQQQQELAESATTAKRRPPHSSPLFPFHLPQILPRSPSRLLTTSSYCGPSRREGSNTVRS